MEGGGGCRKSYQDVSSVTQVSGQFGMFMCLTLLTPAWWLVNRLGVLNTTTTKMCTCTFARIVSSFTQLGEKYAELFYSRWTF